MHLLSVAFATIIMTLLGLYKDWLGDLYVNRSLGTHRIVLLILPVCAALLLVFSIPDQVVIVTWGFAISAVVAWITGCVYFQSRRESANVDHARTVRTINLWLGLGLAVGSVVCLTLGVLK